MGKPSLEMQCMHWSLPDLGLGPQGLLRPGFFLEGYRKESKMGKHCGVRRWGQS